MMAMSRRRFWVVVIAVVLAVTIALVVVQMAGLHFDGQSGPVTVVSQ